MRTQTIAIEFTLTAASANELVPKLEILGLTRGRFRVLIPSIRSEQDADSAQVRSFFLDQNALGEPTWTPLTNNGFVIGGLAVYHRLAVMLACQALVALVRTPRADVGSDLPNGSVLIDLGEV